jgi:hypothetical protein
MTSAQTIRGPPPCGTSLLESSIPDWMFSKCRLPDVGNGVEDDDISDHITRFQLSDVQAVC